jgi:hypothetical protein
MSEQEQECEPCRIVGKLCEILEKGKRRERSIVNPAGIMDRYYIVRDLAAEEETGKKRCNEIFDLLKDNKIGPEEARRIMNEEYGSYKVGAALDAILGARVADFIFGVELERRMKEQDRA